MKYTKHIIIIALIPFALYGTHTMYKDWILGKYCYSHKDAIGELIQELDVGGLNG